MRRYPARGEASGTGTPASVEFALRRVRLLACALVAVRLVSSQSLPILLVAGLSGAFLAMNGLSRLAETQPRGGSAHARHRATRRRHRVRAARRVGAARQVRFRRLGHPRAPGHRGCDPIRASRRVHQLGRARGRIARVEHDQLGHDSALVARAAAHRRVPRGVAHRFPRREPGGRNRGAPTRQGRRRTPGRAAARRRARRPREHTPRRRRDPRGAA